MMAVQLKAIELASYTMQQASNEKVIPKRYRWSIGDRIVDAALDIASHIDMANTLDLNDETQSRERLLEQQKALASIFRLMTLTYILRGISNFKEDKLVHWTGLANEAQLLLKGWMKSDGERLRGR